MIVTILGCGGSGGVPRIGGPDDAGNWGDCDPDEPRNRRTRSSILVESDGQRILVDTSPDLRQQLLNARVGALDAVLITHGHADHVHGIDELRSIRRNLGRPVDLYAPEPVLADLAARFGYVFDGSGAYPATATAHPLSAGGETICGLSVDAFQQDHGYGAVSYGYRIGPIAYSTDVVGLDDDAFAVLEGLDLWIVDCLRFDPHPTHAHFELALEWIDRVRPKRALLTHLNESLDYNALEKRCPPNINAAYDGLRIVIEQKSGTY